LQERFPSEKELYMPRLQCGAISVLFFALSIPIGFAQSGIITTYAGPGLPVNGASAVTQAIDFPGSTALDGAGGFYVSSQYQNRVYRVDASGKINLVAGNGILGYSGDGRAATSAQLSTPWGIAVDSAGNLFIADTNNNRIRKVTPAGIISTVAGNGNPGYSGDGGVATAAKLYWPTGVAVDSSGNLYITDFYYSVIRKVTSDGVIRTVAGNGNMAYSGDGGPATAAGLFLPTATTLDSSGNLYIADYYNSRVRKVTAAGVISTVAGTGSSGYTGDGGQATAAQIGRPIGVAIDSAGNLYIADYKNTQVRKVTAAGVITTVTGTGTGGFAGDGGPATVAQLGAIMGVMVDSSGNLYIADTNNDRVRKVTPDGIINTIAGNGSQGFSGDGSSTTAAMMRLPSGIALDSSGNLYIADFNNNRIRKVTPAGIVSTVAGNGSKAYSGDGGPATIASLNWPNKLKIDSSGNIYISDSYNFRIRKVGLDGKIITVVGTGSSGFSGDGGLATLAQFSYIGGVAIDSAGNLYFSDYQNHRIRKVTPSGIVNTVAGSGASGPSAGGYGGDGGPATAARLNHPTGLTVDSAGNIYIGDAGNNVIRKVTAAGIISTIAGNGSTYFSGDGGLAINAGLNGGGGVIQNPSLGLALDSANNLYIAETCSSLIRKITADGMINTVVGNPMSVTDGIMSLGVFNTNTNGGYSGDGGIATAAQLSYTADVAVDSAGNLFIVDQLNFRIRKFSSILDCSSLAVNTGGVAACRTAGTKTATRTGYSKLTVNSGATPYGTGVFSFKQDGVTVSETGVPASPPTTRARIFIDYRASVTAIPGQSSSGTININTGLSVVNQGSATASVEYVLRNLNGDLLTVGHGAITKDNHIACFINQLQQMAAPDFSLPLNFQINTQFATLEIASDQPLSVVALRMTTNQRGEALFTTTPVADMTKALTNTSIYFPQFADGGGYTTSLILLNTSTQAETGSLQILDNNGNALVVNQAGGTTNSSFQYSIPAGGAYHFQSGGLSTSASAGWVRIVPDVSSLTPIGSGVFSYNPSSVLVSESGIPSSVPATHARVYVDLSGGHNAGLAIANIGSTAASITINAYQSDGVSGAGTSWGPLTLAAYGHDAKFADQLIEGLPAGYRGVLDISSTTPFAALTMRSLKNERDDFLMTTFPIADANQTAPSPVVFPHVADGGGYITEFMLISAGGAASTTPGFYNEAGAPTDFSH
jgi:trimeric autotransporter adhesin